MSLRVHILATSAHPKFYILAMTRKHHQWSNKDCEGRNGKEEILAENRKFSSLVLSP